jgi:hypothetical protein
VIWTGLAMSPAFDSAVPAAVNALGGRQSARTLHFFVSGALCSSSWSTLPWLFLQDSGAACGR